MPMTPEDGLEQAAESSLQPGPALLRRAWIIRGQRIVGVITSFVVGQGTAQGLSLLAGLFLVRHLSIQAYAQFGLATGFQTMFSTLMDLGFAGTIVPMVGPDKNDRAIVGRYVRSAKHLRDLSFYVLAPIASVVFLAIMHRQHWPGALQAVLLLTTLVALYCSGKGSYFSAPLILHGKLRSYYVLQVSAGVFRLSSYLVLAFVGGLNAWVAAAIGALTIFFMAEWFARQAKPLMDWPAREDPATDKKIINNVLPAIPAMIYTAFQAQLTLLLISLFGGKTAYIAQVAALGRISQIFTVLATFNLIVVEPFVARLTHRRLLPTFLLLSGLATLVLAPLVSAAFTWPQVLVFVLGPKYSDLRDLLGWVVLASSISYVAGLIWVMNRARKWIFWSGSFVEIGLLILVQVAFVTLVGIKTTRDAVFLSLAASVCVLIAHVYVSINGLWISHREHRLTSMSSVTGA